MSKFAMGNKPKKTGRPLIKVDSELVRKLASIGCTMIEIGSICDCSVDVLERRFADVIKKARDMGRMSLRRMQWKAAEGGNTTMMIWLGKQLLDQKDRQELSGPNNGPIEIKGTLSQAVDEANRKK